MASGPCPNIRSYDYDIVAVVVAVIAAVVVVVGGVGGGVWLWFLF